MTIIARHLIGVSVKGHGAVGNGVTDDTAAFISAAAECNALLQAGLTSNIKHAGATLVFDGGRYNLATLAAPIAIKCDARDEGAEVIVPAAYAGEVFRVGLDASGDLMAGARVSLPGVSKAAGSAIVAGSVGYRLCNINASYIRLGRALYFERAVQAGGIGQGTVYCDIHLSEMLYNKIGLSLKPGSGGWANSNRFYGGNLAVYPSYTGSTFTAGYIHIEMDGRSPATAVVGNNFFGTSLEGSAVAKLIDANSAYGNNFFGCYHESGITAAAVTVSGDTLTRTAHGLSVNDMMAFGASVVPTGMTLTQGYYVVSVPTADTFKVSRSKGGTAITFGSSGTSVVYYRAFPAVFSQTGAELCYDNKLINWLVPPSTLIDVQQSGQAYGNGLDWPSRSITEVFDTDGTPVHRGRNKSSATHGPIWAAYNNAVDPSNRAKEWSVAMSADGVLFGSGGSETGRLLNSGGVLTYEANASGVLAQIASCWRSPSLTTLGTTNVVANSRTIVTLTVTGAAVGDYVTPYVQSALPDGIAIVWARASAADSVQVCFYNWTAADIDIAGVQLKAMASRAFF